MNKRIILASLLLVVTCLLVGIWAMLRQQPPELPPPTISPSITPSSTPIPATATPSPTLSPTSSPSATPTETPTATPSPAPTIQPSPTPSPSPGPTTTILLHIVQPGESLCLIAFAAYGECVKWVEIWEANGRFRKPHLIYPDQELVIP